MKFKWKSQPRRFKAGSRFRQMRSLRDSAGSLPDIGSLWIATRDGAGTTPASSPADRRPRTPPPSLYIRTAGREFPSDGKTLVKTGREWVSHRDGASLYIMAKPGAHASGSYRFIICFPSGVYCAAGLGLGGRRGGAFHWRNYGGFPQWRFGGGLRLWNCGGPLPFQADGLSGNVRLRQQRGNRFPPQKLYATPTGIQRGLIQGSRDLRRALCQGQHKKRTAPNRQANVIK